MSARIFISQPMAGKSEEALDRQRQLLMDWVRHEHGVFDTIEIPRMSRWQAESSHPAYCIGRSIQDMSHATLVVFAPGWEDARGCKIEHEVCDQYGIPYVEYTGGDLC